MHFRALGPVEVCSAGERISVGGPRHQAVLALLLAAAGRVVSVDTLVDALWGGRRPATARAQVHTCVSGLRRSLALHSGGAMIITQAPGYLLRLGPDDTSDLAQFAELAERGRTAALDGDPAGAARHLRGALAQWRGEPFGGLSHGGAFLDDIAAGLWEQRASVVDMLVQAEFTLGHHADVINELRAEVDRDPLAERPGAQLIMALYGAGRRVEALRQYQIFRRTLVEELGIQPGEHLRRLEWLILADDPTAVDGRHPPAPVSAAPASEESGPDVARPPAEAASPSTLVPHHLPPAVADFVGRDDELVAIVERLAGDRSAAGVSPAPVAMVIGGAGVGKSTLAIRTAWRLTADFPDGQLYADLHGTAQHASHPRWAPTADLTDEAAGAGRHGALAGLLKRFLGGLGVPAGAVPDDIEERLALYRQRLSGRRVLIVLDDVSSEDEIAPLLPGSDTCAVLATSRRRLTGIPGALTVELAPFRQADSVQLLAEVLGDQRVAADPAGAARLAQACGNLPLAVRVAAARLAARPHWSLRRMAERLTAGTALDELRYGSLAVRDSVMLTYDLLPAAAQRLFRMLGLFDSPDFGEWIAGPLLDAAVDSHPEDVLADLVELHLLQVTMVDGVARYTLHDLIRAIARERAATDDAAATRFAAMERAFRALLSLLDVSRASIVGHDDTDDRAAQRRPVPHRYRAEVAQHPAGWLLRETRFIVAAVVQSAAMELPDLAWQLAVAAAPGFEVNRSLDAWTESHVAARLAVEKHGDRAGLAAIDRSLAELAVLSDNITRAEVRRGVVTAMLDELACW